MGGGHLPILGGRRHHDMISLKFCMQLRVLERSFVDARGIEGAGGGCEDFARAEHAADEIDLLIER